MIPVLLILVPLVAGLVNFALPNPKTVKTWSLLTALVTVAIAAYGVGYAKMPQAATLLHADYAWNNLIGARFSVDMDGMSLLLCLLTAIAFPLIFLSIQQDETPRSNHYYGLMLLTQAGLMGVFTASDALLFYFFWELALIPVYFLCSSWGGEKRIAVTFKFFIYTFVGSLLMLLGILYLYFQTQQKGVASFAIADLINLNLPLKEQSRLFWLFFVAFAIKMPIFPFHTWQPDAYEQTNTPTTMVLSALMVKMGLYALLRWLGPLLPYATYSWGDTVTTMAVVGIVYASIIAIRQDDAKRLVAYSSIAHIGLMAAAIFSSNIDGIQGAIIQMFAHGVNILGMWVVLDIIEKSTGTRKLSELGGLAVKAPRLTLLLVIVAFANIALPLTNAFVGEFMMFNGLFNSTITKYNYVFTVAAAMGIIFGAVYTLRMVQQVFYGEVKQQQVAQVLDIKWNQTVVLIAVVVMILVFGVYPKPMIELTQDSVDFLNNHLIVNKP